MLQMVCFLNPMVIVDSFNRITIDGSKVEAQTSDGTRISTPNQSKDVQTRTSTSAPEGATPSTSKPSSSYAAALKAKPTDWHIEFSMDDQVLPLDMTIYGAVYQHESRKHAAAGGAVTAGQSASTTASSLLNPHSLWNGVYTIKFRKVPGLPPLPEGGFKLLARDEIVANAPFFLLAV